MTEWVAYYADGARYTSDTHAPADLPPYGVAVIVVRDGRFNRRLLHGKDYYGWSEALGRWVELADAAAVVIRAMREPLLIRAGEYQREADFERILIAASQDPDLPPPAKGQHPGPPHPAWSE